MRIPIIALLVVLTACCSFGASFGGLGFLPDGAHSAAIDVSADGSVVVGYSGSAFTGAFQAFRWTAAGGMVGLGTLPGTGLLSSYAWGVSGDGLTIVGWSSGNGSSQAFRWLLATGMTGLGDLPGGSFLSTAYGTSSDGSTIVGYGTTTAGVGESGQRAVRWPSGGAPQALDSRDSSDANAVSGDGLTIVGNQYFGGNNQAFRWTLATGMVGLGIPAGYTQSIARSISADGSVIVGQAVGSGGSEAFLWTQATGVVGLGDLPGGTFYSSAWDTSNAGSLIVGGGSSEAGDEAFIWDSAHGMRNLRDVLISDYGITNLTGWTLLAARAISADGQTIVGEGVNPSGQGEAWRVTGVTRPDLRLGAAASRKVHGSAGTFDVNLPLAGEPGVECRNSGGDLLLVFTFNSTMASGGATVTGGTASVAGTPTFDHNTITVELTGVADVQQITVTLRNVTDIFSRTLPDTAVSVNMLIGDTNGNRSVNASDISGTKTQTGSPVTAANFRTDINASGAITASDISQVKANSGHTLSP
jgi:probable HAF family extracellular repeat protein